jgi:hypothetical protein
MSTPIQNLSFTDDGEINVQSLLNETQIGGQSQVPMTVLPPNFQNPPSQMDQEIMEDQVDDEVIESDPLPETLNPTINIFGRDIDQDTLVIMSIMMVFWSLIFFRSGVTDVLGNNMTLYAIFILFSLYLLANTFTSGNKSGGVVYELNILLTVEQMVSILYGTMVLFMLFNKNIPIIDSFKPAITSVSVIIIFLLTIASMWVNLYTSGRSFRFLRKFKQGVYNIALVCFSMILVIYLQSANGQQLPSLTQRFRL